MAFINRYVKPFYPPYDILTKFLNDLEFEQEMVIPVESPSGGDFIREPEIPCKGPVTSFGHKIPKARVYIILK